MTSKQMKYVMKSVTVCAELCRKMHEDDPDATAEDCETELSMIWSSFLCNFEF